MCLATVGEGGKPSARFVLMKGYDERGVTWYTNYNRCVSSPIVQNHDRNLPSLSAVLIFIVWFGSGFHLYISKANPERNALVALTYSADR